MTLTYTQKRRVAKITHDILYSSKRRKSPYTEIGIKRLKCFRKSCSNKADSQWQICADGRTYRPICKECDIRMNRLVLEFMEFDNIDKLMKEYENK